MNCGSYSQSLWRNKSPNSCCVCLREYVSQRDPWVIIKAAFPWYYVITVNGRPHPCSNTAFVIPDPAVILQAYFVPITAGLPHCPHYPYHAWRTVLYFVWCQLANANMGLRYLSALVSCYFLLSVLETWSCAVCSAHNPGLIFRLCSMLITYITFKAQS